MTRTPAISALLSLFGLLLIVLGGCQSPPSVPSETLRSQADFHYDQGHYDTAADRYGEITDRFPGDWQAQYRLGLCRLELGQYTEAHQALAVAIDRRPGDQDVADALAESLYRLGEHGRLFTFVQGRATTTQSVYAYRRLGRYAMQIGDPDSARRAFDTAIALDDGRSVEPYLDAAMLAEDLGRLDEAVTRLRQAYSISPRDRRVNDRLRSLGEVPGPTLAMPPEGDG